MKNNKGFSMVELIVSFSITTVIVVVLFQIVVVLKDVYEKSSIKTSLLNKQNILVDLIYDDILEVGLTNAVSCGNYCVNLTFDNGATKTLKYSNNTISYGDYATSIIKGSTVGNINITTNNNVISINMEITHRLFSDDNFGINIVHYNSNIGNNT